MTPPATFSSSASFSSVPLPGRPPCRQRLDELLGRELEPAGCGHRQERGHCTLFLRQGPVHLVPQVGVLLGLPKEPVECPLDSS